jgi:hypothetical protein
MRVVALVGFCLIAACAKPVPTRETSFSAVPVATKAGITPTSEIEIDGLRVKSGSIAGIGSNGPVWGFSDLALDLSRIRLEIRMARGGAPLSRLLPEGALAVVNGGYFEADYRPSTWLKEGGIELSPKSDTSKGGVLAVDDAQLYIGAFSGLHFEPQLAVQSFPMIVEPDFKSGIHSDDGRRAARTIACIVAGKLHFIVIAAPRGEGPTLFEAAALLRQQPPLGFGCSAALNLDGGPSTGVWFAPRVSARSRAPLSNVGYGIALVPR